ncbi:YitT family protein [Halalkalibacterium halodurans]|uniref:YitT family protein n=1 Tax=Halalkalibacterium halodurans TaxID=86665 RepID=UPI00068018F3|nr:YitT family protein [Halalkalibacterium halodurans]MED4172904.1 YitT family protein [Halalkalibacterium halodurans]
MRTVKHRRQPHSPVRQGVIDYTYVLIGSVFVALAFNLFLLPNQVASGGVSGISILINYTLGLEPAYVQWAFNIPLFLLGVWLLGGLKYGIKALIGTSFLPLVVLLTKDLPPATLDPLLGAIFGGMGVGLGLGIVFRARASTGGTDLAAQIVHKYTGLSVGMCVFMIDGLIVMSAAFLFGIEYALYALIALFVTGKTIDLVQIGVGYAKVALIISNQQEEVRKGILQDIDRGVTKLVGYGGYTNQERPVLMCVVGQSEVTKLKQIVQSIDPQAFVIVTSATEVLGEGFKRA